MITFTDGPACGQILSLSRSPIMLRVGYNRVTHKWDALDQVDDRADRNDSIFVYRIDGYQGMAHVDGRDPKTGKRFGRWEAMASYALLPEQPADADVRENAAWQQWTTTNREKLLAGMPTGVREQHHKENARAKQQESP